MLLLVSSYNRLSHPHTTHLGPLTSLNHVCILFQQFNLSKDDKRKSGASGIPSFSEYHHHVLATRYSINIIRRLDKYRRVCLSQSLFRSMNHEDRSPGPSNRLNKGYQPVERREEDIWNDARFAEDGPQYHSEDEDEEMKTASGRSSVDYNLAKNERSLIREAILKCHADVWREFYDWEPDDSLHILRSLAAARPDSEAAHEPVEDNWPLVSHDQDRDNDHHDSESSEMEFDVYEWDSDGALHSGRMPPPVIVSAETNVVPHPKYEACAPAYTSIGLDISHSRPDCRFIKHADERGFDKCGHLRKFCSISWQQPGRDPNRTPGR